MKIAMPAHTPEYRARIMCYGVYDDSQRHEEAYVDEFTAHPDGWRRKSSSDQRNYFIRALPDSVRVLHGRTDGGGRVIIVIITDPEIGPDEAEMLFAARDLPESEEVHFQWEVLWS